MMYALAIVIAIVLLFFLHRLLKKNEGKMQWWLVLYGAVSCIYAFILPSVVIRELARGFDWAETTQMVLMSMATLIVIVAVTSMFPKRRKKVWE